MKVGNNGGLELASRLNKLKHEEYLVSWYIAVAKKRGWPEVVRLLAQNKETEERMKMLIKKRLEK